jgi:hypothetical protein
MLLLAESTDEALDRVNAPQPVGRTCPTPMRVAAADRGRDAHTAVCKA